MNTLWRKSWCETDKEILAFTIGEDARLDERLVPYDVLGSLAHARGLERIGILSAEECAAICEVLSRIHDRWRKGEFSLLPDDEDVHSALERTLVAELGGTGKKIHAGRSRNDQVLTALRLFMKEVLLETMESLAAVVRRTCSEGSRFMDAAVPGYTHLRRAMPSTVAFWYGAFAEGWTEALEAGVPLFSRLDRSPLGAGAGFGVPLPLDREYTAALLGFGGVQVNAAAAQNSRGRFEALLLSWLADIGADVEKMAWDLLLFSTREFGFVAIPQSFCTGSSIMPQKENPDVLELLRAAPSLIRAARNEVEAAAAKLPSSYHRDLQLTKAPLMRGVDNARRMLRIIPELLGGLAWNEERTAAACSRDIYATHHALALVREGIPFREAYGRVAEELRAGRLESRPQAPGGGPAPGESREDTGIEEALARVAATETWIRSTKRALENRWNRLLGRGLPTEGP